MKELNREELAWAAGLVDGEGHIGLHLSKAKVHARAYGVIQLSVSQKSREVLDRLHKVLGVGKVYGPYNHKPRKNVYFLFCVHNFEHTQAAIAMLWPWLSHVKRQQVKDTMTAHAEYVERPKMKFGPRTKGTE